MSENLTRTYVLDFFTKVELTPVGTVNVFGTMQQDQLTNYECRLSVMDMSVFNTTNAAKATLTMGEVALMFMQQYTSFQPESPSPVQRKWFATGAASKYGQVIKDKNSLREFEYTPAAQ